jgi:L-2-hydroxyglutarate oxidase
MIYDYAVIGGGIVGLATAMALQERDPGCSLVLIEKQDRVGFHQTGHNSGVIHAGIYYTPGSLKAQLCREGSQRMKAFCAEHQIPVRVPGKLLVATSEVEAERMERLRERGEQNGLHPVPVSRQELASLEPNIVGVGGLFIEPSALVDYKQVSQAMLDVIRAGGADIELGCEVTAIDEGSESVEIRIGQRSLRARSLVACAGLQADRVAKLAGVATDFQIVPFRGQYYRLAPRLNSIVTRMIYPIPDPELPFLGIHLTPTIDGGVTVGPSAVLGLSRERYERVGFSARDVWDYARFPGMWRVARANVKVGATEMRNFLSKREYLKQCHKYCPSLTVDDLLPQAPGIRAQAVLADGSLVEDFLIERTARTLHVCNAPSPAATASIRLGEIIAERCTSLSSSA